VKGKRGGAIRHAAVFGSNCRRRFPWPRAAAGTVSLSGEAPARLVGSGVELDALSGPLAIDDAAVALARSVKPVGDLCSD
jgi:hypothetical protein